MTPDEIQQLRDLITELDEESRQGDMFSEAKSQWLESCLESPNDYQFDLLWDHLDGDTLYWLEGHMSACEPEYLEPGNIYHWMVKAVEHSSL